MHHTIKSILTVIIWIALLQDLATAQDFYYSASDLQKISQFDTVSNSHGTLVFINKSVNIYNNNEQSRIPNAGIVFYPLKLQIHIKKNLVSAVKVWGFERKEDEIDVQNTRVYQKKDLNIKLNQLSEHAHSTKLINIDGKSYINLNDFVDYIDRIVAESEDLADQLIYLNLDETKKIDLASVVLKEPTIDGITIDNFQDIVSVDTIKSSVGTLSLINKLINVYSGSSGVQTKSKSMKTKSYRPISALIYFSGGLVSEIRVYLEVRDTESPNYKQIYYFQQSGLSVEIDDLNSYIKTFDDYQKKYCGNSGIMIKSTVKPDEFICSGDFLFYFKKLGVNRSFPKDGLVEIRREENKPRTSKPLFKNQDLSLLITVDAYSDLLAASGTESNGIIQLEPSIKIPTRRIPSSVTNEGKTRVYWFSMIDFNGIVRRFDSNEDFVKASPIGSSVDTIDVSRLELIQRSRLTVGLDINILKNSNRTIDLFFDIGLRYNFTDIKIDTSANAADQNFDLIPTKSLNSYTINPSATLKFYKSDNFGAEITGDLLFNGLLKNSDIPTVEESGITGLWSTGFQLFYTSPEKARYFLRFENTRRFKNASDDFVQLLFGVSTDLNFRGL